MCVTPPPRDQVVLPIPGEGVGYYAEALVRYSRAKTGRLRKYKKLLFFVQKSHSREHHFYEVQNDH